MGLLQEKETQNLQRCSKRPFVVNNKHPENQDVFISSKPLAALKTYVGTL